MVRHGQMLVSLIDFISDSLSFTAGNLYKNHGTSFSLSNLSVPNKAGLREKAAGAGPFPNLKGTVLNEALFPVLSTFSCYLHSSFILFFGPFIHLISFSIWLSVAVFPSYLFSVQFVCPTADCGQVCQLKAVRGRLSTKTVPFQSLKDCHTALAVVTKYKCFRFVMGIKNNHIWSANITRVHISTILYTPYHDKTHWA